jgi:hypothetical protein
MAQPLLPCFLFLQANGDRGAYWRVLSDAGISRQRLESFDRPIVCEPEWFGSGKKDALIREFRNYLGILKAVHSGAIALYVVIRATCSCAGAIELQLILSLPSGVFVLRRFALGWLQVAAMLGCFHGLVVLLQLPMKSASMRQTPAP